MSKNKKNQFGNLEVVVLVIMTSLISIGMTCFIFSKSNVPNEIEETIPLSDEMKLFIDNYNYFIDNYYGDINEQQLLEKAFEAVINTAGDSFTNYFDELQTEKFNIMIEGSYLGLGIVIERDKNGQYMSIVSVYPNSPASKAGLQAGDIITSINGVDTFTITVAAFRDIIKTSDVSDFTITYKRNDVSKTINISRSIIELESVYSSIKEVNNQKIGYIAVDIFAANTDEQFSKALKSLESNNIDSLIIDLRDNTGGHLNVVTNMVSEFLDKNHIIYHIKTKEGVEAIYSSGKTTKTYPIVLLVNQYSASASELMTSALKEQYNATVVGVKTFGKSTIQEVKEYTNGTEYKVTVKEWLTSRSVRINKVGITPDYEVVLSEKYKKNPIEANDNQLQKAFELLK